MTTSSEYHLNVANLRRAISEDAIDPAPYEAAKRKHGQPVLVRKRSGDEWGVLFPDGWYWSSTDLNGHAVPPLDHTVQRENKLVYWESRRFWATEERRLWEQHREDFASGITETLWFDLVRYLDRRRHCADEQALCNRMLADIEVGVDEHPLCLLGLAYAPTDFVFNDVEPPRRLEDIL